MSQEKACEALGLTGRTYRNWKHAPNGDGRLNRVNYKSPLQMKESEIEQAIKRYCMPDVCDLSLPQAFYKLLDEEGFYVCSLRTLYRLFHERGLMGKRTPTRAAQNRSRPTSYSATKPNAVWTWDITYFRQSAYAAKFYYAYVIVDVYSRYIISAKVFDADNAEYASRFLREAFDEYGIVPGQLVVHSDNGASMKAAQTLSVLEERGVTFSHSRPRVSNDNPYSESLFRTLKYSGTFVYPRNGFDSLEHAQEWLGSFVNHYNEVQRHRGIRMVTPGSKFRGKDVEILRKRKQTMLKAKQRAPHRWIQRDALLNCEPINTVWLNPEYGQQEEKSA